MASDIKIEVIENVVEIHYADGINGITPHIGENGNWWTGTTDTGVPAQGYILDVFERADLLKNISTENIFDLPISEIAKSLPDRICISLNNDTAYWSNQDKTKKSPFSVEKEIITQSGNREYRFNLPLNDIIDIYTNEPIYLVVSLDKVIPFMLLSFINDLIIQQNSYGQDSQTDRILSPLTQSYPSLLVHRTLNSKRLFDKVALYANADEKYQEKGVVANPLGIEYGKNTDVIVGISYSSKETNYYSYRGQFYSNYNNYFIPFPNALLNTVYIDSENQLVFCLTPVLETWAKAFDITNIEDSQGSDNIGVTINMNSIFLYPNKKKILEDTNDLTSIESWYLNTNNNENLITEDNNKIKL